MSVRVLLCVAVIDLQCREAGRVELFSSEEF